MLAVGGGYQSLHSEDDFGQNIAREKSTQSKGAVNNILLRTASEISRVSVDTYKHLILKLATLRTEYDDKILQQNGIHYMTSDEKKQQINRYYENMIGGSCGGSLTKFKDEFSPQEYLKINKFLQTLQMAQNRFNNGMDKGNEDESNIRANARGGNTDDPRGDRYLPISDRPTRVQQKPVQQKVEEPQIEEPIQQVQEPVQQTQEPVKKNNIFSKMMNMLKRGNKVNEGNVIRLNESELKQLIKEAINEVIY